MALAAGILAVLVGELGKVGGDVVAGVGIELFDELLSERFLFGLVLDEVLAQYATINTYTRLEVTDLTSGETLSWKPRLGSRRLM